MRLSRTRDLQEVARTSTEFRGRGVTEDIVQFTNGGVSLRLPLEEREEEEEEEEEWSAANGVKRMQEEWGMKEGEGIARMDAVRVGTILLVTEVSNVLRRGDR